MHTDVKSRYLNGFTLVELLVVLVILGLLAGLVGPQVTRYLDRAKTDTARLQVNDIGAALDLFYLDLGRYPTTQEGLAALVNPPADAEHWKGPYLTGRRVPVDPWGNPYYYRSPGKYGAYDLSFLGADNTATDADNGRNIAGWE